MVEKIVARVGVPVPATRDCYKSEWANQQNRHDPLVLSTTCSDTHVSQAKVVGEKLGTRI